MKWYDFLASLFTEKKDKQENDKLHFNEIRNVPVSIMQNSKVLSKEDFDLTHSNEPFRSIECDSEEFNLQKYALKA